MKITKSLLLLACIALPLAACKKEEAPQQENTVVAVTAPDSGDREQWRAYLNQEVPKHMEGISNQPYVYLVPSVGSEQFEGEYERLLEKAQVDLARGIVRGNLLAYAGHNSDKVADLVVAAFADVDPGSMKGVRVVFVGDAADNGRVQEAVSPAGVEYVFVEK